MQVVATRVKQAPTAVVLTPGSTARPGMALAEPCVARSPLLRRLGVPLWLWRLGRTPLAALVMHLALLDATAFAQDRQDGPVASRAPSPPNAQASTSQPLNDWQSAEHESARELTRQGRDHAARRDDGLAIRRFSDAITLDPTFGPAYLELAAARERLGDLAEAERTYALAIQRLPNYASAYCARGLLRDRIGEREQAVRDFEMAAALGDEPIALQKIAAHYLVRRSWPAALATFRRLAIVAARERDARSEHDAIVQVRALGILCREIDPVLSGDKGRGWVRKAMAHIEQRRAM